MINNKIRDEKSQQIQRRSKIGLKIHENRLEKCFHIRAKYINTKRN